MNRFKHLIKAAAAIALTYVLCASALLQPMAVYAATLQAQQPAAEVADASSAQDSSAGDVSDDTADGVSKDADSADAAQDKATLTGAADEDAAANGEDAAAPESLDAGDEQTTDDTVIGDSEANSWRYQNGELRSDLQDDNATDLGIESRSMHEMPEGATLQGIDVSGHQKDIDWQKVKDAGIDFAILKIGNINAREPDGWYTDSYFQRNVTECERLGIPYGVYAYSYAKNADDAVKGADHIIALLKGHNPTLPVYLDLEDNSIKDTDHATIATAFCNTISAAGYTPGIYANASWFKNILTDPCFTNSGWNIWTAQYWYGQRYDASLGLGPEYPAKFDCWQYSYLSTVPGIDGYCDINYWYRVSTSDHWEKTEDGVFYVSADGQPYKGERLIGGKWYHFDEGTGAMSTGFTKLETKTVYYLEDGPMAYGERRIDGKWYHFDEVTGAMSTGMTDLGYKTVLYGEDGAMLYGRQEYRGKVYYLAPADGSLRTSGWVSLDCDSYGYLGSDGSVSLVRKQAQDGSWYLLDLDGVILKGWVRCGSASFYCDPITGTLTIGQRLIDNHWYDFDDSGVMQIGFVKLTEGTSSKWVYYDDDGKMLYGEQLINGHWYYLNKTTGAVTYGWLYLDSGQKWVWYGPEGGNGQMRYGHQIVDGVQRYFDPVTGACDKIGYQNPAGYFQVSTRSVNIPHLGQGKFGYRTPSRISISATRQDCINVMIARAYDYVGTTPYIWDYSCAPGVGVDCAGLVMQCLYATGMDLGRYTPWDHYYTPGHDHYANDMWNDSRFKHLDFSQRQRGDLICYNGHIAIYIGNDQIIEAASPRIGVRIHSVYVGYPIKGVLRPFV